METRTVILHEDVVERLLAEARRADTSLSVVANDAIREAFGLPRPTPQRFVVSARPMGRRRGFEVECVEELIERLEGPLHR